MKSTLLALTLLLATPLVHGQSDLRCEGASRDEVVDLLSSLALTAELFDIQRPGSPDVRALRQMVIDEDPALMEVGCRVLSSYPSVAAQLEQAIIAAQSPEGMLAIEALASGADRGTLEFCLSVPVTNGLLIGRFAINVVAELGSFACSSQQCFPLACIGTCITASVTQGLVPIFDILLSISGFACLTNHDVETDDWAITINGGTGAISRSSGSLADLQDEVEQRLLPELDSVISNVARQQTLDAARQALDTAVEQSSSGLERVVSGVETGNDRIDTYQQRLRRLEIELQLADPNGEVPVLFRLPESLDGQLIEVREVVAQAINASLDASQPINAALDRLREGDDHFNAQEYADAFEDYRSAYLELVE